MIAQLASNVSKRLRWPRRRLFHEGFRRTASMTAGIDE